MRAAARGVMLTSGAGARTSVDMGFRTFAKVLARQPRGVAPTVARVSVQEVSTPRRRVNAGRGGLMGLRRDAWT
ncbi:hypothetical protein GCM10008171_11170 [Methylopila jiangsuensis]|uniref:Uncharacterized protein n=1 Tax=Methylopila jiangsuensis TaxID=586230 RepID=A0A9W6JHY8_9HYPH|nr:hypothetical protein GCM10008171_11170 [Methylopila jiangsuensis]